MSSVSTTLALAISLDVSVFLATFLVIFPAELPDKSFVATLVLATRFPRLWVWLGATAAFALQMVIAVAAGQLLSLLPERIVLAVTTLLFAVGAVLLTRAGLRARSEEETEAAEEMEEIERVASSRGRGAVAAFATTFAVIFAAEWGDLTQLIAAGQAARTAAPLSVFLGAWLAESAVAGFGVLIGNWLQSRVALWRIGVLSGVVLAVLAVVTLVELFRL